jgi:hypothetical protein
MLELAPPGSDTVTGAIASIEQHLPQGCRDAIRRVYLDDGTDTWLRRALGDPVEERRASLVAALSLETLISAVRMEIGGGFRLPVSTSSMTAGCESVVWLRQRQIPSIVGPGALGALTGGADTLHAVGWFSDTPWRRLTSDRRMVERLASIRRRIDHPTAVVARPALLVANASTEEIAAACTIDDRSGTDALLKGPRIVDLSDALGADETWMAIDAALARSDPSSTAAPSGGVFELPGGSRVGTWALEPGPDGSADGWIATPDGLCQDGMTWRLTAFHGETRIIDEVLSADGMADGEAAVLRVPGWLTADLRVGSPAGLVVETLAADPARAGRPLWLPNVDGDGVRLALALEGPIWVDGPGVPG